MTRDHSDNLLPKMKHKRRIKGGIVAFIGFLLSPLSWWNDLFVNVPLALAFAWAASWFFPRLFTVSFVVGYWLTNVLGLVLMQKGGAAGQGLRPGGDRGKERSLADCRSQKSGTWLLGLASSGEGFTLMRGNSDRLESPSTNCAYRCGMYSGKGCKTLNRISSKITAV